MQNKDCSNEQVSTVRFCLVVRLRCGFGCVISCGFDDTICVVSDARFPSSVEFTSITQFVLTSVKGLTKLEPNRLKFDTRNDKIDQEYMNSSRDSVSNFVFNFNQRE